MRQLSPAIGLFVSAIAMLTVSAASAQDSKSGCSRDVSRFCRAVMDNGDMAVLACLKDNRAKLTRTCQKVLTDHNQ